MFIQDIFEHSLYWLRNDKSSMVNIAFSIC